MIGAIALGATGALTLVAGVPAWSFFGFFSLGLCTHRVGMGQSETFVVEDQLAGAVPEPIDSGAAKIFQLCGMQAEQPATEAQVATTCSHKRFPAHRVDCGEGEIFPTLRNGGERTDDRRTAGNSLRHKGFPVHGAGNEGLAGFSGLRKGGWGRGDAEMGPGLTQWADVSGPQVAPTRRGARTGRGGQKKSRAKGPAQVDQVGMIGCSVLAPTAHRCQTSQTGAEEEHGSWLRDGSLLTINRYM